MSAPSGDQMAEKSSVASTVNRVRNPRDALTIQTSRVLSDALARLTEARVPSGDRPRSLNCNRSSMTAVWFPARSDHAMRAVPVLPSPW